MYSHCTDNLHIANYERFTSAELFKVLDILTLYNKNVYCVTSIIFELCYREFRLILISKNVLSKNANLKRLTQYIEHLVVQERFSKEKFRTLCHELIAEDNISLDIIWWLDQNNLVYFEDYWSAKSTSEIISQLKTLILSCADDIEQQQIARNIFLKLLLGINSLTSSVLCKKIQIIFDIYLKDALDEFMLDPNSAKLIRFIKVFNETDYFYGNLIKKICRNILQKFISNNQEKVTIYNAIENQELWSTSHLGPTALDIYFEIVKRFILEELFEVLQEVPEQEVNWRFVLTIIAVFIHKVSDSYKLLKSQINRHLQTLIDNTTTSTFHHSITRDITQLLSSVAISRQACLEQPDPSHEYSEWFANTFGANSVLRTGTSPAAWTLLLGALHGALPHEPAWALRVHVARALRAPPHHHGEMMTYKEACRARLKGLQSESEGHGDRVVEVGGGGKSGSDSEDFC